MRAMERLLLDVFTSQGLKDAARVAKKAADIAELAERDAKIYELRAVLTEEVISDRFGLTQRRVRQIVREQLRLKKVG